MYALQVEGMSCNHCVSMVTKSIREIDASANVNVDLVTQQVQVQSSASLDDIKEAVSDAGYPVLKSTVI